MSGKPRDLGKNLPVSVPRVLVPAGTRFKREKETETETKKTQRHKETETDTGRETKAEIENRQKWRQRRQA